MESLTSITLNLQNPNIATVTYGVQNDRLSRKINAQLVDGSTPWAPPAGALATIRFLKPDGKAGFYDTDEAGNPATVIDGSTVTMTIVEQALTVPGDVYMQLNFYTSDGERLTTFCLLLRVQQNVLTDATIISSDYYNILSAQIAAVLEAAASLTGMTASASGLPTGSDPTVEVTGGSEGEPYNLAFGIPAGPRGPAEIPTTTTTYQAGTSPTTAPTGSWSATPPSVPPGDYLWTRTVLTYSDGTVATYYTIARQGIDGSGAQGTQMPLPDAMTGSPGSSLFFSPEDHIHPFGQALFDVIYPVGSIYLSVGSVNPATLFGGTWEQIKDTFLLSAGDTYAAGTTGGEATHTLTTTEIPAHTHGQATLTGSFTIRNGDSIDVLGACSGIVSRSDYSSTYSNAVAKVAKSSAPHVGNIDASHTHTSVGGNGAHNNMPPYLAVYVWKRTA